MVRQLDALLDEMRGTDDLLALQDVVLRFWSVVVEGSMILALNALDRTCRQVMPQLVRLIATELRTLQTWSGPSKPEMETPRPPPRRAS